MDAKGRESDPAFSPQRHDEIADPDELRTSNIQLPTSNSWGPVGKAEKTVLIVAALRPKNRIGFASLPRFHVCVITPACFPTDETPFSRIRVIKNEHP